MRDVVVEMWFSLCVTSIAEPLVNYLRQLEAQGKTHVNVDDDARLLLREFYKRALGRPSQPASPQSPTQPQVQVQVATQAVSPRLAEVAEVAEVAVAPQEEACLVVGGGTKEEKLVSLKQQAADWAPAKALGGLRQTMVFSTGNLNADIMLVGEAPGFDEERVGEPFSGKAGQKLDAILKAMGTERKNVYISNIVKFRPKMPNQTTSNRKLTRDEVDVWLPFIHEEVKMVAPKVILCLGGATAQVMLGVDGSVSELRGEFHRYEDVPLRVTYHPSYILNDEATLEKRMLWLDMLSVMELLGMPISDKQRGYFAKQS